MIKLLYKGNKYEFKGDMQNLSEVISFKTKLDKIIIINFFKEYTNKAQLDEIINNKDSNININLDDIIEDYKRNTGLPIFYGIENINIVENDNLDPLNGVSAVDRENGNINVTYAVKMLDGTSITLQDAIKTIGEYKIVYYCIDDSGSKGEESCSLYVHGSLSYSFANRVDLRQRNKFYSFDHIYFSYINYKGETIQVYPKNKVLDLDQNIIGKYELYFIGEHPINKTIITIKQDVYIHSSIQINVKKVFSQVQGFDLELLDSYFKENVELYINDIDNNGNIKKSNVNYKYTLPKNWDNNIPGTYKILVESTDVFEDSEITRFEDTVDIIVYKAGKPIIITDEANFITVQGYPINLFNAVTIINDENKDLSNIKVTIIDTVTEGIFTEEDAFNRLGSYVLKYTYSDKFGNQADVVEKMLYVNGDIEIRTEEVVNGRVDEDFGVQGYFTYFDVRLQRDEYISYVQKVNGIITPFIKNDEPCLNFVEYKMTHPMNPDCKLTFNQKVYVHSNPFILINEFDKFVFKGDGFNVFDYINSIQCYSVHILEDGTPFKKYLEIEPTFTPAYNNDVVGVYRLKLYAYDVFNYSKGESTEYINIHVESGSKPVLSSDYDLHMVIGDDDIDLMAGVHSHDINDGDDFGTLDLKIYDEYNHQVLKEDAYVKIGRYTLVYTIRNSSNIISEPISRFLYIHGKMMYKNINRIDIRQSNDTYHLQKDFHYYDTYAQKDVYVEPLCYSVFVSTGEEYGDQFLPKSKIGMFDVTYTFINPINKREFTLNQKVYVHGNPTITAIENNKILVTGDKTFILKDYIKKNFIIDITTVNDDGSLNHQSYPPVNYYTVPFFNTDFFGEYKIVISVQNTINDSSVNFYFDSKITVTLGHIPVITLDYDLEDIIQFDPIDPLKGVYCTDVEDETIEVIYEVRRKYDNKLINIDDVTKEVEEYEIIYTATDSSGNKAEPRKRTIRVYSMIYLRPYELYDPFDRLDIRQSIGEYFNILSSLPIEFLYEDYKHDIITVPQEYVVPYINGNIQYNIPLDKLQRIDINWVITHPINQDHFVTRTQYIYIQGNPYIIVNEPEKFVLKDDITFNLKEFLALTKGYVERVQDDGKIITVECVVQSKVHPTFDVSKLYVYDITYTVDDKWKDFTVRVTATAVIKVINGYPITVEGSHLDLGNVAAFSKMTVNSNTMQQSLYPRADYPAEIKHHGYQSKNKVKLTNKTNGEFKTYAKVVSDEYIEIDLKVKKDSNEVLPFAPEAELELVNQNDIEKEYYFVVEILGNTTNEDLYLSFYEDNDGMTIFDKMGLFTNFSTQNINGGVTYLVSDELKINPNLAKFKGHKYLFRLDVPEGINTGKIKIRYALYEKNEISHTDELVYLPYTEGNQAGFIIKLPNGKLLKHIWQVYEGGLKHTANEKIKEEIFIDYLKESIDYTQIMYNSTLDGQGYREIGIDYLIETPDLAPYKRHLNGNGWTLAEEYSTENTLGFYLIVDNLEFYKNQYTIWCDRFQDGYIGSFIDQEECIFQDQRIIKYPNYDGTMEEILVNVIGIRINKVRLPFDGEFDYNNTNIAKSFLIWLQSNPVKVCYPATSLFNEPFNLDFKPAELEGFNRIQIFSPLSINTKFTLEYFTNDGPPFIDEEIDAEYTFDLGRTPKAILGKLTKDGTMYIVNGNNKDNYLSEREDIYDKPIESKNINSSEFMDYKSMIKRIVFKYSVKMTKTYLFNSLMSLTNIVGINHLDTSTATDMSKMFIACMNLTDLDVSNFKTDNVTDMSYMFYSCRALTSLDLSNFNTSKVTNMERMFANTANIKKLSLLSFDTKNVTNMNGMFMYSGISNLLFFDKDTSNVTEMTNMFQGCKELLTLDLSSFNIKSVEGLNGIFAACDKITNINISNWKNETDYISLSGMFSGCYALTDIVMDNLYINNIANLSNAFNDCNSLITLDLSNFNISKCDNISSIFANCNKLTKIDISTWDLSKITNIMSSFKECNSLSAYIKLINPITNSNMYHECFLNAANNGKSQIVVDYNEATESMIDAVIATKVAENANVIKGKGPAGQVIKIGKPVLSDVTISVYHNGNAIMDGVGDIMDIPDNFWTTQTLKYDILNFTVKEGNLIKPTSLKNFFKGLRTVNNIDLTNLDTSKATDMTSMFSDCTILTKLNISTLNTSNVSSMELMFNMCNSLTNLDLSNFDTSNVKNMSFMFNQCISLVNLNLSNWHTSNVTTMESIFSCCINLTSLNINHFDTSNVTNMFGVFQICNSLTNLNITNWNTSNVTNMNSMFNQCTSLTELDLSNFDITNVVSIDDMFYECSNLKTLDLTSFKFNENIRYLNNVFKNCTSLKTLDISSWNVNYITYMSGLFENCTSLEYLDLSNFDTHYLYDARSMFKECNKLSTVIYFRNKLDDNMYEDMFLNAALKENNAEIIVDYTDDITNIDDMIATKVNENSNVHKRDTATNITNVYEIGYPIRSDVTATLYSNGVLEFDGIADIISLSYNDNAAWYNERNLIKKVIVKTGNNIKPSFISYYFSNLPICTEMNLKYLDTNNVYSMISVFSNSKALDNLDLSNWNTSKVTTMQNMFSGCSKLTTLNLSNWNTSKVTAMTNMFSGCSKLTTLNLSNWNTSKVSDMYAMFSKCQNLTSLDVSNFNTSKVTAMSAMFNECSSLTNLDVSSFDTSNVTDMYYMFSFCSSLTNVDLSNFNTSKVTDMNSMFSFCSSLTNVDVSNFNTSKVTDMENMFSNCSSLTNLNLSNWVLSNNLISMAQMFCICTELKTISSTNEFSIKVNDNIDLSLVFFGCENLTTVLKFLKNSYSEFTYTNLFFGAALKENNAEIIVDYSSYLFDIVDDMIATKQNENSNVHKRDEIMSKPLAVYEIGTPNKSDVTATVYEHGLLEFDGSGDIVKFNSEDQLPWIHNGYASKITMIRFKKGNNLQPTNLDYLLAGCTESTRLLNPENLDTSHVISMNSTFSNSKKLLKLDLSTWNTSNVTSMNNTFENCYVMNELNVSTWNTTKVTSMNSTFSGCNELINLDVSSFNTANVTNMSDMFKNCFKVRELDLSKFNTIKVTTLTGMFNGCTDLTSLDVSSFNTSNVTSLNNVFTTCETLVDLDLSKWNTSKVTTMNNTFEGCTELRTLNVSTWNTSNVTSMNSMFKGCNFLSNLSIISNFDFTNVFNMASMFENCTLINGDLNLNNNVISSFDSMFTGAATDENVLVTVFYNPLITNIDTIIATKSTNSHIVKGDKHSVLKTYNIGNPNSSDVVATLYKDGILEFAGHGDIIEINNFSEIPWKDEVNSISIISFIKGNLIKPTNVAHLFESLSNVTTIDLSNIDLSGRITTMNSMFSNCSKLTSIIGLENINVDNVIDMSYMFNNCNLLSSINISSWIVPNIEKIEYLFNNCESLNEIDLYNFNTSKVTNMSYVFSNCNNLVNLNIRRFDTRNVTNMDYMFYNCINIDNIDLSVIDFSKVKNMNSTFENCNSLITTIKLDNVLTNYTDLFKNCANKTSINAKVIVDYTSATENLIDTYIATKQNENSNVVKGEKITILKTYNIGRPTLTDVTATLYSNHLFEFDGNGDINVDEHSGNTIFDTSVLYGTIRFKNGSNVQPIHMDALFCNINSYMDESKLNFDFINLDTSKLLTLNTTFAYTGNIEKINLNICDLTNLESINSAFTGMQSSNFVLDNMNLPNVTNIGDTFSYLDSKCKSLHLHNWKLNKVTALNNTFFGDMSETIQSIDITGWYTPELKYLTSTFEGTLGLKEVIGLSDLDTSKVVSMENLFVECGVINLNISGWNTSSLTNMTRTFLGCTSLIELHLENWDVSKVTTMENTFGYTRNLTSLDLSKWNVNSVANMNDMFSSSGITNLNISGWNVPNVITMSSMFSDCSNLISLDLSNFVMQNTTDISYMFKGCSNLVDLKISDTLLNISDISYLFNNSTKIKTELVIRNTISNANMYKNAFNNCASDGSGKIILNYTSDTSSFVDRLIASKSANSNVVKGSQIDESIYYIGYPNIKDVTVLVNNTNNTIEIDGTGDIINFQTASSYSPLYDRSNYTISFKNNNTIQPTQLNEFFRSLKKSTIDFSNLDTSKLISLRGTFAETEGLSIDFSKLDTSNVTDMSSMFEFYFISNTDHILDVSNIKTDKVVNFTNMFARSTIKKFIGIENWNTSNVEFMTGMFIDSEIQELDGIYNWNVSNAIDMKGMFRGTQSLSKLDLSNWRTPKLTNISEMFYDNYSRTTLNLANWDVSNVTDMHWCFGDQGVLKNIDLTNWNTSNVTNMSYMFGGCTELLEIKGLENFNMINAKDTSKMFSECNKLSGELLINTSDITSYSSMFYNTSIEGNSEFIVDYISDNYILCTKLVKTKAFDSNVHLKDKDIVIGTYKIGKPNLDDVVMTLSSKGELIFDGSGDMIEDPINTSLSNDLLELVENIKFKELSTIQPASCKNLFNSYRSPIKSINLKSLDTSKCTNMSNMFAQLGNNNTTNVDISTLNTSNVTDMSNMFMSTTLLNLDLSNFDTSKVTTMEAMFVNFGFYNSDEVTLNISNFNTDSLINVFRMFVGSEVSSITLPTKWGSNITNIGRMFQSCTKLKIIHNIDKLNISNVTEIINVFQNCESIESLNINNWDTSKVTNMEYLFHNCSNLTSLDLSNWDTNKVTNMSGMFQNCSKLNKLNIYNFDLNNVTEFYSFMYNCQSLDSKIKLTKKYNECDYNGAFWNTAFDTSMNYCGLEIDYTNNLTTDDIEEIIVKTSPSQSRLFKTNKNLEPKVYNIGKINETDVTATLYDNGILEFDGTGEIKKITDPFNDIPWHIKKWNVTGVRNNILEVKFKEGNTINLTDISNLFYGLVIANKIDLTNANLTNVTNLESLFSLCFHLKEIININQKLDKINNLNGIFNRCIGLRNLDIFNWDTSNVTDIRFAFSGCNLLTSSITIRSKIPSYTYLFNDCSIDPNSKFTVNYTIFDTDKQTSLNYVKNMVNTKSSNSNIVINEEPVQ